MQEVELTVPQVRLRLTHRAAGFAKKNRNVSREREKEKVNHQIL